uniref:Uncharacterized protein n=1 Tax=Vespula pensylvanica TaxID=30213 RepID=A0A834NQN7_VESPE|nr:hypothetical protein H0235_012383 [Vespula pensylvanica]
MPRHRFYRTEQKSRLPDLTSDVCRLLSYKGLNGLVKGHVEERETKVRTKRKKIRNEEEKGEEKEKEDEDEDEDQDENNETEKKRGFNEESRKKSIETKELERSSSRETLSSPVGNSPVCCQPCSPPCSPPPAPAAYISSARASSRRLTTGSGLGGLPSPERDPFGRLLRFLKTFYTELGKRDPPHMPAWVCPLPLGSLCPAHFKPHLQLVHKSEQEHRLENIKPDQIFAPVRVSITNRPHLSFTSSSSSS